MRLKQILLLLSLWECVQINIGWTQPFTASIVTEQTGDLRERRKRIQMEDATQISHEYVYSIFRSIFEKGLMDGLAMTMTSYDEFRDLVTATGLDWETYLDGVFYDGIKKVDPLSAWKMIPTKGELFSNIYFDPNDYKYSCPLGFLYYIVGLDEGIKSGGAESSVKEESLSSLFLFGITMREKYIDTVEPALVELK